MANKRIQKKRAKAELQRDKSMVIANLIVMFNAESPRYEQLKIAKMLWKMSLEELFDLSERAIRVWIGYHSPLRRRISRTKLPVFDFPGYRPTITDVRER